MSDVEPSVLAAATAGAGWAFERIYAVLSPAVLGYLRSQGVDDPAGATNDVFLRVFRGLAGFEGTPASFRSWVFTIAHHLVVDRRRFASRRPREVTTVRPPEPASSMPGPEDALLASDGLGRLLGVLDLLTADQRDVLLLRFVADLSLEEVAVAQGRTVGSVKALQHRALASVRRILEESSAAPVSPPAVVTLTSS